MPTIGTLSFQFLSWIACLKRIGQSKICSYSFIRTSALLDLSYLYILFKWHVAPQLEMMCSAKYSKVYKNMISVCLWWELISTIRSSQLLLLTVALPWSVLISCSSKVVYKNYLSYIIRLTRGLLRLYKPKTTKIPHQCQIIGFFLLVYLARFDRLFPPR